WFESGSMPFAQVHYPFENKEWFEEHFPADFIVEYINQTRGWFYTLHVLAGALFDKPAFQNVICHGIVLDAKGLKLSKKLRNYTEPDEIFSSKGADALRWYLMASPIVRGGDLRLDDAGIDDVVRQVLLPIWNAYSFFTLYANADGYRAELRSDSTHLLDRYILAKTRGLVEAVTERMDAYDLPGATAEIQAFIDALNNWYIRRSRDRFWAPAAETSAHKDDAYDTLYTALTTLCRVAAPLLPMITEEIYGGLTGGQSVHLTSWPSLDELPSDPDLVDHMDRVRDVASVGLRLREDAGLRVRLPLSKLTVAGHRASNLDELRSLIADELNVKQVELFDEIGDLAEFVLKPNGKVLGPVLGGDVQVVFGAAKRGEWSANSDGTVTVAGRTLTPDQFELGLVAREGTAAAGLRTNDAVVVLDTEVTPELEAEGQARDLIRHIQQIRKDLDLAVTDRIEVTIAADASVVSVVDAYRKMIAGAVLADSVAISDEPVTDAKLVKVGGAQASLGVAKA
ncbi:MAG: class I tRNA ligase family protein, partial [Acidimicrobiales bacterium]|nr:class I tRNA ligase family protein [Acidimicrobiales bacterium]